MRPTFALLGALALALTVGSAQAHVPFLKPNQFDVLHGRLQIESAFTEFPFQADFAQDAPGFSITTPDGQTHAIAPTARTRAATYLEPTVQAEGSYRISTGVRKGPLYKAVETADTKLYFADDMARTKGTPTSMQYYSRADVYIAKGAPNYTPRPAGDGAEIVPLAAPTRLTVGQPLAFQVLKNGQPVPRARVVVVYDNEQFRQRRIEDLYDVENVRQSNIVADADGRFSLTPRHGGLVLLLVTIHDKLRPELWESHNAALTLEANLPMPPQSAGAANAANAADATNSTQPAN